MTLEVNVLVEAVEAFLGRLPGSTQPRQQPALNTDFGQHHTQGDISSLEDWFAEAAFQHETDTYLALLGGAPIPDAADNLPPNFVARVRAKGRALLEERGLVAPQSDGG